MSNCNCPECNCEKKIAKVAIIGKARAGKSQAEGYLENIYDFTSLDFSYALKYYAHSIFPWIKSDPKPRRLYQQFGQAMRNLDVEGAQDVWIEHTFKRMNTLIKGGFTDKILINGGRQPNEIARLKAEGFTIIRVSASDSVRLERMKAEGDAFTEADLQHETESYIDGFDVDYEIVNDGDIFDLYKQIDVIMDGLGVKQWKAKE